MARFSTDLQTGYTLEEINQILQQFAQAEGFELKQFEGEIVFKKGVGLLTAPQFIKVLLAPGQVHLEAWLKYALLPGVYVGEMGITGFFGAVPKSMLKGRVDKLIQAITAKAPAAEPAAIPQQQQAQA